MDACNLLVYDNSVVFIFTVIVEGIHCFGCDCWSGSLPIRTLSKLSMDEQGTKDKKCLLLKTCRMNCL